MYIEIASAIIAAGSAVSCYIAYKTTRALAISAGYQAQEASVSSRTSTAASDRSSACANAAARDLKLAEACVASTKGDAAVTMGFMNDTLSISAKHRGVAEKIKTETEAAREAALNHACTAAKFVEATAAHCKIAEQHAGASATHRMAAHDYAIDAEGHARKVASHVDSVGRLSQTVADIAAQTKVKLATRTDYSTEGSNIGGR